MSTTIQFTPSTAAPFQFKPTISSTLYTAVVTWNAFAERYYLNLYDESGDLVLCTAIVSSGPRLGATLTWEDTGFGGVATATTASAHNIPIGQLANVRISQTDTAYDGNWQVLSTGATTVTYAFANPNETQPLAGQLSFPVNLVQALGSGWLIYDYSTQTFEWETTSSD